jgi:4'-phosphopantetheinyl transferase EntD
MEKFSEIVETHRLPLTIPIYPWLADHRFQGRAVLPAVLAMEILAQSVHEQYPDLPVDRILHAGFDKFLFLPAGARKLDAFNEITVYENKDVQTNLVISVRMGKTSILRKLTHASICFSPRVSGIEPLPVDLMASLPGVCFRISSERLYKELVPFGPAWQNIHHILYLSAHGALATISAPDQKTNDGNYRQLLGSPFPLDAAFHAACAWGQRFNGIVAFPVGFERRQVFMPARSGNNYFTRVFPLGTDGPFLLFDIWIYDENACLLEAVKGLKMRDVSAGKWQPPNWVRSDNTGKPLENLKPGCEKLSIMEIDTVGIPASHALSPHERPRFVKMGDLRARSYLAARLCCKYLSRKLSEDDSMTPAQAITTVSPDGIRPCCPRTGSGEIIEYCSVSHDRRFAITVAAKHPVGVDVEFLSDRVIKVKDKFMNKTEWQKCCRFSLGKIHAALRIWSIKEAVSKALNIPFTACWERVCVERIDVRESRGIVDGMPFAASHGAIGNHLFTLVGFP